MYMYNMYVLGHKVTEEEEQNNREKEEQINHNVIS